jgi:hypothetical protein
MNLSNMLLELTLFVIEVPLEPSVSTDRDNGMCHIMLYIKIMRNYTMKEKRK